MENFLGTLIFLLPGVLAYFWLQAFGINPVVKHSPTEFTSITAFLWFPVFSGTLMLHNGLMAMLNNPWYGKQIWTVEQLKIAANSFIFLFVFLLLSIIVSLVFCLFWISWGYGIQQKIVNLVRKQRNLAPFSETTAVWDEVFGKNESQVVEISRLDKKENITVIGVIRKASRTFEAERNFCLDDIKFMTELVQEYQIPVEKVFMDVKAGIFVRVFDSNEIRKLVPLKEAKTISLEEEPQV